MKIKDLIEKLQGMDPEGEIHSIDCDDKVSMDIDIDIMYGCANGYVLNYYTKDYNLPVMVIKSPYHFGEYK
jgi:hypothetical protein